MLLVLLNQYSYTYIESSSTTTVNSRIWYCIVSTIVLRKCLPSLLTTLHSGNECDTVLGTDFTLQMIPILRAVQYYLVAYESIAILYYALRYQTHGTAFNHKAQNNKLRRIVEHQCMHLVTNRVSWKTAHARSTFTLFENSGKSCNQFEETNHVILVASIPYCVNSFTRFCYSSTVGRMGGLVACAELFSKKCAVSWHKLVMNESNQFPLRFKTCIHRVVRNIWTS